MAKTYNRLEDGFIKHIDKRLERQRKTTGSSERGSKKLGKGNRSAYGKRVSSIESEKEHAREELSSKHKTYSTQSGIGIKNTLQYSVAQSNLRKKAKLDKRTRPILSTQGTPPKKTWSVPTDRYKIVAPVIKRKN